MEVDWREIFQVQQVEPPKIKTCGCASGSCKAAKKFRCECHCKHSFHGVNAKNQLADLREKLFQKDRFNERLGTSLEAAVIIA